MSELLLFFLLQMLFDGGNVLFILLCVLPGTSLQACHGGCSDLILNAYVAYFRL